MKNILLILICLVLIGCGYDAPVIAPNSNYAFVVASIEDFGEGIAIYGSKNNQYWQSNFTKKPHIILPIGMFNVGDTIKVDIFYK